MWVVHIRRKPPEGNVRWKVWRIIGNVSHNLEARKTYLIVKLIKHWKTIKLSTLESKLGREKFTHAHRQRSYNFILWTWINVNMHCELNGEKCEAKHNSSEFTKVCLMKEKWNLISNIRKKKLQQTVTSLVIQRASRVMKNLISLLINFLIVSFSLSFYTGDLLWPFIILNRQARVIFWWN